MAQRVSGLSFQSCGLVHTCCTWLGTSLVCMQQTQVVVLKSPADFGKATVLGKHRRAHCALALVCSSRQSCTPMPAPVFLQAPGLQQQGLHAVQAQPCQALHS